ncbi:MAG: LacI family transcriptional regulator [Roseburia sp.]|nr:LacI family transcriptional regulator [Roseburia sp.]
MSLKKIAELTGTSVSTVSRVLNHPEHSCNRPGLTEKIWEAANSLNYIPHAAARNLRLGTTEDTGHFTVDIFLTRFDSMDTDLFFRELFQHIREELIWQDCLLGEILSSENIIASEKASPAAETIPYKSAAKPRADARRREAALMPKKPDTGLIILGKCPSELVPLLKKRYDYIAGIDRNPTDYEYDEVVCSGLAAAEKAVEYLISLGHKNIAYIGDCTYEARYIGYYQALLNHKIPIDYVNIHPSDQTMEQGFAIMNAIIHSPRRPTAVFCANDCTALGALKALRQSKKRGYVPSIISIDNINDSQKSTPMLTTIDIPKKEMGHLALTLLLDRKKGAHRENVRIELPCRLIERDSCSYHPD